MTRQVLSSGEIGTEQEQPNPESYSLSTEENVLGSQVLRQSEVGGAVVQSGESTKEREDADSHSDTVHPDRRESASVVSPPDEAETSRKDPGEQSDNLQIERSDSGSYIRAIFRQGEIGEEREDADSHRDSVHAERNGQESDSFRHEGETEQEDAEHQNSPHAEGDELISVSSPIKVGAEREEPAPDCYPPQTEENVFGSQVFQKGEAGDEREDAKAYIPQIASNESELEVFRSEDVVRGREDTVPQSHTFHMESGESELNTCVIHACTDPPSVASASVSESSVRKLDIKGPLPVFPGTNLEPRKTGLFSKLSKLFRRRKSPRGTQEQKRVSPEIMQAAKFKNLHLLKKTDAKGSQAIWAGAAT